MANKIIKKVGSKENGREQDGLLDSKGGGCMVNEMEGRRMADWIVKKVAGNGREQDG